MTFTITADSAPSSDIVVNLQVTAQGPSLDETATISLSLAAGERTIELIMDTGSGSAIAGDVTVGFSVLAGTGYRVGSPSVVSVSMTDPPAGPVARGSTGKATPTPGPVARQIIPPPAHRGFRPER